MGDNDFEQASETNGVKVIFPTDIDSNRLTWKGNPGHLEGVLYEITCWTRSVRI